jgi:hypothetical protein
MVKKKIRPHPVPQLNKNTGYLLPLPPMLLRDVAPYGTTPILPLIWGGGQRGDWLLSLGNGMQAGSLGLLE